MLKSFGNFLFLSFFKSSISMFDILCWIGIYTMVTMFGPWYWLLFFIQVPVSSFLEAWANQ